MKRSFVARLGSILIIIAALVGGLSTSGQLKEARANEDEPVCCNCKQNTSYTCVVNEVAVPDHKLYNCPGCSCSCITQQ